jgi:protocatechuate 3,4-dioxygenase alpha subunit
MTLPLCPSQTIGPFSHEAWRWACAATEGVDSTAETISISGILRDGDGTPINDGMIEAWSPDSAGAERAHALPGFRRVASGEDGGFTLTLSRVAGAGEPAALVTVFARGLVLHQFTAVFLGDDPGLDQSEILRQVPAGRRATLIAAKTGAATYAWDIRMQGAQETVFFDYE